MDLPIIPFANYNLKIFYFGIVILMKKMMARWGFPTLINLSVIILFYSFPVFAAEVQNQELEQHLQQLRKEIKTLLQSANKTRHDKLKLAGLYKNEGEDQKAESLCFEVLKASPGNSSALYLLGELYQRSYNLLKAREILNGINSGTPEYKEALIRLLEINVTLKDREESENIIKTINKLFDYGLINTALGIYNSSSLKLDPTRASENFQKAISLEPKSIEPKYYLAAIYLDKNKWKEARKLFNDVISLNYYHSGAHALLGFLEFIDKNPVKAFRELKTAIALNPMDLRARTSTGNGMTAKDYRELEAGRPDLVQSPEFIEAGEQAVILINQGKIREARYLVEKLIEKYPENIHSYIQAGSLAITLGEPEEAIEYFKKALKISQDYGLANNGMAVAIRSLIKNQEKNSKNLDLDFFDYSSLNMESLKKIFINYNDLPEKYQKIVKYSIFPLKNYLPVLAAAGSTHYIIPLYERSTDYIYGREYKNQRSFDFRLWDDIRGRGGFNSATGIEDLQGAYYLDFNTLTHEFTHQVHGFAMTTEQKEKIKALYDLARRDNRFLDYYAGSNEFEYFAQGVEAYNSIQGKQTLKATAKNTRELLYKTDKPLFEFIVDATGKTDLPENFAASYTQRGDNFYYKGDFAEAEKAYKEALATFPDYYEALNNLGSLYLYFKSANEARKIHQQAAAKFPEKAAAYLNLGDDEFYLNGNYSKSVEFFQKAAVNEPDNPEAVLRLGNAYYQMGSLRESIFYYKKALEKDPRSVAANLGLAYNLLTGGNYEKSEEYFKKALAIDTSSPDAHAELARLYLLENNLLKAEKELEQAKQLDRDNPLVKSVSGLIALQKKDSSEAIKSFQDSGVLDPGNLLFKARLAGAYAAGGSFSEANRLLKEVSDNINGAELPKTVFDKEKNRYFSYNVKSAPDLAEYYLTLGQVLEAQGDNPGAGTAYLKSLEILPFFSRTFEKLEKINLKNLVPENKINEIKNLREKFYQFRNESGI
jgi:tetratricopeptide (TPR) repeat protein